MTENKPIIIDGIDVSGCEYYQYNMCTATKDNYGDCSYYCKDYEMKDCYYKQLQRKEQECEELTADTVYLRDRVGKLERAILRRNEQLEQLKVENEELKMKNSILEDEYKILEDNLDSRTRDFEDVIDGYKQILAEIKDIATNMSNDCFYSDFKCGKKCDMESNCTFKCKNQIIQKCEEVNK